MILRGWAIALLLLGSCTAIAREAAVQTVIDNDVWRAVYSRPVARYGHNIMGDVPEWSRLCLIAGADRRCIDLPENMIFEDFVPRLSDFDNDGVPEVITVQSSLRGGAALVIYARQAEGLIKLAATENFGRPFRWLAPVGLADFDGDGTTDIAFIETPHLGKTLKVWTLRNHHLVQIAAAPGLSNHQIGDSTLTSGVRHCKGSPQIITLNGDWSRIMISSVRNSAINSTDAGPYHGAASMQKVLECR